MDLLRWAFCTLAMLAVSLILFDMERLHTIAAPQVPKVPPLLQSNLFTETEGILLLTCSVWIVIMASTILIFYLIVDEGGPGSWAKKIAAILKTYWTNMMNLLGASVMDIFLDVFLIFMISCLWLLGTIVGRDQDSDEMVQAQEEQIRNVRNHQRNLRRALGIQWWGTWLGWYHPLVF